MQNLKRIFCLFLTLVILSTNVAAVDVIRPGTGGALPGSGAGNGGSKWSVPTDNRHGAGLVISVQKSGDSFISFQNAPPGEESTYHPPGFSEAVAYWTMNFPNTEPESDKVGTYVLPQWAKNENQPAYIKLTPKGNVAYDYGLIDGGVFSYIIGENMLKNWTGLTAFNLAKSSITEASPSYNLPADYWSKKVDELAATNDSHEIIAQLFCAENSVTGIVSQADSDQINKQVLYYLGQADNCENNGKDLCLPDSDVNVLKFMNYLGLLANVLATEPATEREVLKKELDSMCQGFLSGRGYSPLVVTGEVIVPSEYNDDGRMSCWWTPRQCMRAVKGTYIGSSLAPYLNVNGGGSFDPVERLGTSNTSRTSSGGLNMFGKPTRNGWTQFKGSGFSLPTYGNTFSSVAQSVVDEQIGYNPEAFQTSCKQGVRGFGVWGLSTPYIPPHPAPAVPTFSDSVNMYAAGEVAVEVEKPSYVKAVGGYSETLKVTVTVNLTTKYTYQSLKDGTVTDTSSGEGILNTLGFLRAHDKTGSMKPMITVWLGQSQALPALDGSVSETLLRRTRGYNDGGDKLALNLDGEEVASNAIEAETGAGFVWTPVASNMVWQNNGAEGFTISTEGFGLVIRVTDYTKAIQFFEKNGSTLVFTAETPVSGTLDDEASVNQHWFKVGSSVQMGGPSSLDNMDQLETLKAGLRCIPKYAYSTISAVPEDKPYYYSQVQPSYSELKQGTVPATGGGSSETFNSMTGTPTFTETNGRDDFRDTEYEGQGHFYQYFASGGAEFVVQFDGEYVQDQTATRKFTMNFTTEDCGQNTIAHVEAGAHTEGDPPTACSGEHDCPNTTHYTCNPHSVTTKTVEFDVVYTGLCYLKITDVKVWQLVESKLDGMQELIDTDVVTATVQSTPPNVFYHIAGTDDSAGGRMVYDYLPNGETGTAGSTADHLVWDFTTPTACSGTFEAKNLEKVAEIVKNSAAATCLSDFIVLRTSNGDQSILYYEYKAGEGVKIADSAATSTTTASTGTTEATITLTGGAQGSGVAFENRTYQQLWAGNSQCAQGAGMAPEDVTYGGYNGNYSNVNTKYQSSGHTQNINLESTTAYQNLSGVFAPTPKPSDKFRLMNDTLVIPDYKCNGEYYVGDATVFYENILNIGEKTPNYPIVPQAEFGDRLGFTLSSTYSPAHNKINDVVVYNPVSNQNAMIVSLPEDRDQRIAARIVPGVDKTDVCPGDDSCPYLIPRCSVSQHLHTEACYQQISYEVHSGNNTHVHTDECPFHDNAMIWYHDSKGCNYYGEKHPTTSTQECTTCGHSCGYLFSGSIQYLCDGQPCMESGEHDSSLCPNGHGCNGCTICHTCKNSNLYQPPEKVYDCNDLPLNSHVCDHQCYTMFKALLGCADPHHTYSYNWKLYTYGLKHASGSICTGRTCSDPSDLIFPTQLQFSTAQCAAGFLVRHSNGDVHLSVQQGTCTFCGSAYKELLSPAQDQDRVPSDAEWNCYVYGDSRCWAPCGNNENHRKYTTTITQNGATYTMGDFINLDWSFQVYFPNTGDFYGTGVGASSQISPERGKGYANGMDATIFTKAKWVQFPFSVIYQEQTFLPYERIYLDVPATLFTFYLPLHNKEAAQAEIQYGSVAINTQIGLELDCIRDRDHNIENSTWMDKTMSHKHSADRRSYIDVVGRIGNLTLEDTGDFRFANFFKQTVDGWIVPNIVRKVDITKQNMLVMDRVDIRKIPLGSTGVAGNTYGTKDERGVLALIESFPLTPSKNNVSALVRQPIRVGYDSLFDLMTLGNYYGNTIVDDSGTVGQNLLLIKPHYYRMDLDTGNYSPVDVYMDVGGTLTLINDNDSNTIRYDGSAAQVSLNWAEESARRNFSGRETALTSDVANTYDWVELPHSSSWVYGNYNILNLTQRNRTFAGSEYTYRDQSGWNAHKDPSDRLPETRAALQGGRWHFNVGLPSSAVFVYSGQAPSQANIDACREGNAVVFCALEIYAQGEIWTLAYDGSSVNQPFTVTPGGKTYDPVIPYPADKSPKGEEMPIVEIISIDKSSKQDLNTSGTH